MQTLNIMRSIITLFLCLCLLAGCQKYEQRRKTARELRMEHLQAQRLNPRGSLIGRWELIMSVPQNPSAPVTHEAGIYMQLNADSTWERVENGVRTVGERFSNRYDSVKMASRATYHKFWGMYLYKGEMPDLQLSYGLTDTALITSQKSITDEGYIVLGGSTQIWYLMERKGEP